MAELSGEVERRESRRVDLGAIRGVLRRHLGYLCRRNSAHGLVERVVLWGRMVSGQTLRLIFAGLGKSEAYARDGTAWWCRLHMG